MTEYLLYGLPAGETEGWKEELLTCAMSLRAVARVREEAAADGWHSFREATFTPGEVPKFGRNLLSL